MPYLLELVALILMSASGLDYACSSCRHPAVTNQMSEGSRLLVLPLPFTHLDPGLSTCTHRAADHLTTWILNTIFQPCTPAPEKQPAVST